MLFQEVDTLVNLGLTSCQARVYLTLCHFGILGADEVSQHSGVARQDVYRIASTLQELGLVEKIISRPIAFNALPVEKGVSFLLNQRKKETERLEVKLKFLLGDFQVYDKARLGKTEFVLVTREEAILDRMRRLIMNSQSGIDGISTWKRFCDIYSIANVLKKVWSSGVKCRFIIETPQKNRNSESILEVCSKSAFCEVRFIPSCPKIIFDIYDRKEMMLVVDPKKDLSESSVLWSANSCLLTIIKDYFEILWITAMKVPHYSIDDGEF